MIHLMLDADGQQAIGFQLELLAVTVQGAHLDAGRTLDAIVDARHGQATFVVDLLFFAGPGDLRVDEHLQLVFLFGDVDHHHLDMRVHLRRGQADARGVVHGFGHVVDQGLQARVKFGDGLGDRVQARIGVTQDI